MPDPAYTRLTNDERRTQLLALGADLFTRHGYEELSMARFAREAGISKALLYHYFPGKRALFEAVLASAADELRAVTQPDAAQAPAEQLSLSLAAFLAWIDDHAAAYTQLMASLQVPEVRELIDDVREATAQRILGGLRSGAGCGSWTASVWTGCANATCRATRSTSCCCGRSAQRWRRRRRRPRRRGSGSRPAPR
jgi:AcrR family transcriptional regulator